MLMLPMATKSRSCAEAGARHGEFDHFGIVMVHREEHRTTIAVEMGLAKQKERRTALQLEKRCLLSCRPARRR